MEFWGVEVESGQYLKVNPGDGKIVHLSMACLGEVNKVKGSEPVSLYVKCGNQKLGIGTLSSFNFPQLSYDLIFEKEFELSHNWKNGSVFFTGYKAEPPYSSVNENSDDSDEVIPVISANGKPELEAKNGVKLDADETKHEGEIGNPRKNEKTHEKDANGDKNPSGDGQHPKVNGEIKGTEGEDHRDYKETLNKTELSKKRVLGSSEKTPVPDKKAKLVSPQKTVNAQAPRNTEVQLEKANGMTSVHIATPYPSKQVVKAVIDNRQPTNPQTPKSSKDHTCKHCNRSLKTEGGLISHIKAKHNDKY